MFLYEKVKEKQIQHQKTIQIKNEQRDRKIQAILYKSIQEEIIAVIKEYVPNVLEYFNDGIYLIYEEELEDAMEGLIAFRKTVQKKKLSIDEEDTFKNYAVVCSVLFDEEPMYGTLRNTLMQTLQTIVHGLYGSFGVQCSTRKQLEQENRFCVWLTW